MNIRDYILEIYAYYIWYHDCSVKRCKGNISIFVVNMETFKQTLVHHENPSYESYLKVGILV